MKKVLIIMSSYNGEKYIEDQIDSIFQQKNVCCDLLIRDDGSSDNTVKVIANCINRYPGKIALIKGENVGFANSFLLALQNAKPEYNYYAFSDQDDVWLPNKLFRACEKLEKINKTKECLLYASAMDVVNEDLEHMYYQTFRKLRISFGSALSRQRIAGCTMVFNKKMLEVINSYSSRFIEEKLFAHDMLVYYLCLLFGGKVVYDNTPTIYFRRRNESLTLQGKSVIDKIRSMFTIFTIDRDKRYNKVCFLKKTIGDKICYNELNSFNKILYYRDSWKNTVSLALSRYVKTGLFSVDFIYSIAIILRRY